MLKSHPENKPNSEFEDRINSLMAVYFECRSRVGEETNVIISTLQEENIFLKAEMLKRDKFVEKILKDENLYREERSIFFGLE
tara:strand:+ start:418 stop:666 length:249 start_codon:yes stop_codon:yes gene_type:complete